jgi:hypothetical protein
MSALKSSRLFIRTALTLLSAILMYSCGNSTTPIEIVTDIPEVLEYLEYLRSEATAADLKVRFIEDPDRQVALGGIRPDIIISSDIAHSEFSSFLHPIPLFRLEGPGKSIDDGFVLSDLYAGAYRPFLRENAISLVPLAFDLPILYLSESYAEILSGSSSIKYRELMGLSLENNRRSGDNFSEMGFSSLRNLRFMELLIRDFSGSRERIPEPREMESALEMVDGLLAEYEQTPSAQIYFNEVFAYAPDHADMSEGRLYAVMSTLHERSRAANSQISDFPYIWLSSDDGIEVLGPGVYAAVLRGSRRKRAATELIRLMLSSRIQAGYISLNRGTDPSLFLGRLSTNRLVNERIIPEINPGLTFPDESSLMFPQSPDPLWEEIRRDVLIPWLGEHFANDETSIETLYRNIETYYKLNGGYN